MPPDTDNPRSIREFAIALGYTDDDDDNPDRYAPNDGTMLDEFCDRSEWSPEALAEWEKEQKDDEADHWYLHGRRVTGDKTAFHPHWEEWQKRVFVKKLPDVARRELQNLSKYLRRKARRSTPVAKRKRKREREPSPEAQATEHWMLDADYWTGLCIDLCVGWEPDRFGRNKTHWCRVKERHGRDCYSERGLNGISAALEDLTKLKQTYKKRHKYGTSRWRKKAICPKRTISIGPFLPKPVDQLVRTGKTDKDVTNHQEKYAAASIARSYRRGQLGRRVRKQKHIIGDKAMITDTEFDTTSTQLACRVNVSTKTLRDWALLDTWPVDAKKIIDGLAMYNSSKVIKWLRSRPLNVRGRPVKWAYAVNHPALKELMPDK